VKLCTVDPRELSLVLRRLRHLPEGRVRAAVASLRSKGQLSPLVAAEHEGELVLVDGFARQAAAVRLGLTTVSVALLALSSVQMKAQLYLRNRERGLGLLEECALDLSVAASPGNVSPFHTRARNDLPGRDGSVRATRTGRDALPGRDGSVRATRTGRDALPR